VKICGIPVVLDVNYEGYARAAGLCTKRIIVGRKWYELSVEERLAVLYHEVGHCVHHHLVKRLLMLPILLVAPGFVTRWARAQELEADRFAALHGHALPLTTYLARNRAPAAEFHPGTEERMQCLAAE